MLSYLTSVTDLNESVDVIIEENQDKEESYNFDTTAHQTNSICISETYTEQNSIKNQTLMEDSVSHSKSQSANMLGELPSMYFKQAVESQGFADHNVNSMFENVLKNQQISDLISNLSQDFTGFSGLPDKMHRDIFTDVELGLNDCTFKSNFTCVNEFYNSDQSWSDKDYLQASKVDLTQTSLIADTTIQIYNQRVKSKVDVNVYFERQSTFPAEYIDKNRHSLDNLHRIFSNQDKQEARDDDITFEASTTTNHDDFSFTFNTTVTNGEVIRKLDREEMQQRLENQSKSKQTNREKIQEELDSISNRLAKCALLKSSLTEARQEESSQIPARPTTPKKNQSTGKGLS